MNTCGRIVSIALVALVTVDFAGAAGIEHATTTVYVGRHFEVCDHDQPVKYVFNGAIRVARITGSLSSNTRIQRLRLQPGWNHCSTAVGGATLPARTEITAAFAWHPASGQHVPAGPTDSLAAGTVLWIKASAPTVISLSGTDMAPAPATWPAGATFVSGPGQEAMPLAPPAGVTIWKFDAATQSWRVGLSGDLTGVNELPPRLAPGEAIYVHATDTVAAPLPDPAQRIAYYHPDHLGSANAVTDSAGELVEEIAHHPFGVTRHEYRSSPFEPGYGFTQKERDRESGLHQFEARYLAGSLARFISLDPLLVRERGTAIDGALSKPQRLHPYAYAINNPLRFIDPDGQDVAAPAPAKPQTPPRTRGGIQINLIAPDIAGPGIVRDLWTSYFRNVADPAIHHRDWAEWKSSDPGYVKNATSGKLPDQFTAVFLGYDEASIDRDTDLVYGLKPRVSIRTFYTNEEAQKNPALRAAAEARTAQIVEYLQNHPLPQFKNLRHPDGYNSARVSLEAYRKAQDQYEAKMYQSFENRGTEKSR